MAARKHNTELSSAFSPLNAASSRAEPRPISLVVFEVKAEFASSASAVAGARAGRAQGRG